MLVCAASFAEEQGLLPIGQGVSQEYVTEHMTMTNVVNEGTAAHYDFRILVPRGWTQVETESTAASVSAPPTGQLMAVGDPAQPDGSVVFSVHAIDLEQDLRALALWEYHGRNVGQIPVTRREYSEYFVDSLMDKHQAGEDYRIRQSFYLSGPRAYILTGIAPQALYPKYADYFGLITVSFMPLSEPDHRGVNPWVETALGDGLSFRYPESWQLRRIEVEGGDALRLHWNDREGHLQSQMALERESRQLPEEQEFGLMIRMLSEAGLDMPDEFESMTLESTDPLLKARTGRIYRRVQDSRSRLWSVRLLLFEVSGDSVRFWQIFPERDDDFLTWAESLRAFEIVAGSMRTH